MRGAGFNGDGYRFNDLELLTDKRDYQPGDTVNLMVNTNRENSTVLLFARPCNGIYLAAAGAAPAGQERRAAIAVAKKDMPNFFVEALTVSDGKIYNELREVTVPPEQRILNVEVLPSAEKYQPGQQATVKIKVTDQQGIPYAGSLVASIYDKSVEYISGGLERAGHQGVLLEMAAQPQQQHGKQPGEAKRADLQTERGDHADPGRLRRFAGG